MKKTWTAPTLEDFSSSSNKKIKIQNDFSADISESILSQDISINSKKVEEVKQWILNNHRCRAAVLVIIGPPGSGKTVTIKLVAENEGLTILEWINPCTKVVSKDDFDIPFNDRDTFLDISEGKKFEDFVFRSSRYPSVFEPNNQVIILVKDYPNSFIRTPLLFHNFLEKFKAFGKSLIAFIITDDEKLDLYNILFPNELKKKLDVSVIKFNPVSDTYLKKSLTNLCSSFKGDFGSLSSKNLEKIIRNSAGDLRSATTDLITEIRTGILNSNKKGKKRKKKCSSEIEIKVNSMSLYLRDRGYGFYKKMGRILYPKRIIKESQSKVINFVHSYLEIAQEWNTSYLGFLHENYLQTFSKIEDVISASDYFSFCDALSKYSEMDKYSGIITVAGLMMSNTQPKKSGFLAFKKSFNLNRIKDFQSNFSKSILINYGPYQRSFALDVAPFANILKLNFDQQNKTLDCINDCQNRCSDKTIHYKTKDSTDEEEFEIEDFDD